MTELICGDAAARRIAGGAMRGRCEDRRPALQHVTPR